MTQPSNSFYQRRLTQEVRVGTLPMGGKNPIRIQSMTTYDTMDTQQTVEETLRMVDSGCEYVRITAPSLNEAKNLEEIKNQLRKRGCKVPLIADIHFTPKAAELAATIVEKVRINPGNYADKKSFQQLDFTEQTYNDELKRIEDKFSPLVNICKKHGTALRIGTNHGSLSDRIMSKYGDSPLGMVESALEFVRICESMDFYNLVISMKSSNPLVMVQAYRMLVNKLAENNLKPYPLHLGVTEAGEAEDGRIKSAVGIGTLLNEGLGDTIRVSLTEAPEVEAPVARILTERLLTTNVAYKDALTYADSPFLREKTKETQNIGAKNVPRVIADYSRFTDEIQYKDLNPIGYTHLTDTDKWKMKDTGADFIYTGKHPIPFMLPSGLKEINDASTWLRQKNKANTYPVFEVSEVLTQDHHPSLNFVRLSEEEVQTDLFKQLSTIQDKIVIIFMIPSSEHFFKVKEVIKKIRIILPEVPIIFQNNYPDTLAKDSILVHSATDIGSLLVDGFGDGIMLSGDSKNSIGLLNTTAFGILQATRVRITKTEFISCPSCGRTLFDLPETTAMIRQRTDHLKGVKIAIMGCIVNGPGEMADADFGYVGSGKGLISLYKGKDVVKRNIPSQNALDELIDLIKESGRWTELA